MRSLSDPALEIVTGTAGEAVDDLEVQLPAATLERLGFRRVVASPTATAADLHGLIAQLHETQSDHTWRGFGPRDVDRIAEDLWAFENTRRATHVFFYHGVTHGGARELLGTGAVSPELRKVDAPPGFAVVSRCYIMQQFRSERLYAPFLRHRVEHAQALLGARLRGIHFGSSNPRVFHTVRKHAFPVHFMYLGREHVSCSGQSFTVHDFLGLSSRFRGDLLLPPAELRAAGAATRPGELHAALTALCRNQFGLGDYRRLKRLVEATDLAAVFPSEAGRAIHSLMAFMAAIPILDEAAGVDRLPAPVDTEPSEAGTKQNGASHV